MFSAITISFFAFLLMFIGVGIYSATRKQATSDDYLLASRNVNPWFTALSAVATDNSGFMFIGLTGSCYIGGIAGGWLMVGWIAGEWFAWLFVHKRLREKSEEQDIATIPGFLAHGLSHERLVAGLAAIITLVFLIVYTSAQFKAGSTALEEFEINPTAGVVIGAVVVVIYCFAGGIRASIWTDVAQSVVMLVSMLLLVGVAVWQLGGLGATIDKLDAIRVYDAKGGDVRGFMDLIPGGLRFGFPLFLLGWVFAGFGMVGQPHIMIRAMVIDSADNVKKARRIYLSWYIVFAACCVFIGMLARIYLPLEFDAVVYEKAGNALAFNSSELAFPKLADHLLISVLVGLMLAGVFAATVSTADSQVLSCSAALTKDLMPRMGGTYTGLKIGTVLVASAALAIALFGGSVFDRVVFAWSALAGSLGPLMVTRAMGWRMSSAVAVTMMLTGLLSVLIWRFELRWNGAIYDALPGMVAGFVVYFAAVAAWGGLHEQEQEQEAS